MKKRKKRVKRDKLLYVYFFLLITLGLIIFDNYKNATKKIVNNIIQSWGGWNYDPGWWNGENEILNACKYLIKEEKFTREAASGIIGNFKYESNLNPYIREAVGKHDNYGDPELALKLDPDRDTFGPGRGLAQWGDGSGADELGGNRWIKLIKYVNNKNNKNYLVNPQSSWNNKNNSSKDVVTKDWPTLEEQLSFVKYELKSGVVSKKGTLNYKELNSYNIEDATYWFAAIYENPLGEKLSNTIKIRKKEANIVYKKYCSQI